MAQFIITLYKRQPAKYYVRSDLSIAYKPYHLSTVECL